MPVKDNNWNISWTSATRGQTVLQKCPGGHESLGMYIYAYKITCFVSEGRFEVRSISFYVTILCSM